MERSYYDVVIIGGGPAGLSTALYTARANLKTLIIDTDAIGGKLNLYEHIENYPSYTNTDASYLIFNMVQQILKYGVTYKEYVEIDNINLMTKQIVLSDETIVANKIVIATGSKPKKLGIKGEEEFIGRGVSYCATCDGPFFKDKVVAVIGGGNTALEEALYLTKFAKKVYIVHRRDEFRADNTTLKVVFNNTIIDVITNVVPVEIKGDKTVNKLIISHDGIERSLDVDGVFPFIGVVPNSNLFNRLELNQQGFIITDDCMRTSVKDVYAVGDVRNTKFRQVITACSDGAIAGHFLSVDKQ